MVLAKRLVQHVVHFVHAELFLELADGGVLVDVNHLDTGYLSVVFPVFGGQVVGEAGVVRTTSQNPSSGTNLEVGHRFPQSGSHGQLGQRFRLDALYIVYNQAEAVTQVNDRSGAARTHLRREHETGRLALADTDTEEVNFQTGLLGSGLPVAFGTESVAFSHQALRCQSRNLVEVAAVGLAQVVEVGGEAFGTLRLQDGTQGEFGLGGIPNFSISFGTSVFQCGVVIVKAEVFVYQCLHVFILHLCVIFHQLAHGAIVHVVAHALLGLHLVAVGHGHVVHLVAEADDEHIIFFCVSSSFQ